jgi:N-acetylglucosamine malate deacetylase 2
MARVRASGTTDHEHARTGEKLALLAVFAHPEDEALGPTGTLARYASEGIRVAMVTAAREVALVGFPLRLSKGLELSPRETSCSCLTSGTQRICLIDRTGKLEITDEEVMEERLVRLIREQQPQVIVTYGPEGLTGDPDHVLVSRLTTSAFQSAGDSSLYPQHWRDGLTAYQPKKLYYSVLPQSFLKRVQISGLVGVPDEQVTTVLDVASYAEAKMRTLYCQRNHMLDYARGLTEDRMAKWDEEYFILAASVLNRKLRREKDLFAGLR